MIPTLVATMAPVMNSIQLYPQLYKTYSTKRVHDLSFYTLVLVLVTNMLWIAHGYFIFDLSILAASFINLFANILLMWFYMMYRKNKRK